MLARLLTNGTDGQRRSETDRRHRGNAEKDMPTHYDSSLDLITSARKPRQGWQKISSKMVC
jgi:hypothetical protein